jgi:hypothetical protein
MANANPNVSDYLDELEQVLSRPTYPYDKIPKCSTNANLYDGDLEVSKDFESIINSVSIFSLSDDDAVKNEV